MPLSLWITIGIAIAFGAVTAGLFANNRSAKTLVSGLGLTLLAPGLYFFGLMDLIVNGVNSIIDWAQRTVFDTTMTVGASLLGLAIVLLLVGALLKPKPRQARQAKPQQPRQAQAPAARPGVTSGQPAPAQQPKAPAGGSDDDDIEEILRRRGIM